MNEIDFSEKCLKLESLLPNMQRRKFYYCNNIKEIKHCIQQAEDLEHLTVHIFLSDFIENIFSSAKFNLKSLHLQINSMEPIHLGTIITFGQDIEDLEISHYYCGSPKVYNRLSELQQLKRLCVNFHIENFDAFSTVERLVLVNDFRRFSIQPPIQESQFSFP